MTIEQSAIGVVAAEMMEELERTYGEATSSASRSSSRSIRRREHRALQVLGRLDRLHGQGPAGPCPRQPREVVARECRYRIRYRRVTSRDGATRCPSTSRPSRKRSLARRAGTTQAASAESVGRRVAELRALHAAVARVRASARSCGALRWSMISILATWRTLGRLSSEQRLAESASLESRSDAIGDRGAPPRSPPTMTERPLTAALDLRGLLATLARGTRSTTRSSAVSRSRSTGTVDDEGPRRDRGPDDPNPRAPAPNALIELEAVPRDMPGSRVADARAAARRRRSSRRSRRAAASCTSSATFPARRTYRELRAAALVIELDGIALPIAALDDLIAMKRASAAPLGSARRSPP